MDITTAAGRPSDATRVGRAALIDIWPVIVSVAPFGMVIGVTIADLGVPPGIGLLSSLLIYAGSAQLAALTLLGSGGGLVAIVVAAAIVNARLLLYGAALEPRFRQQPAWFRWLGPHTIVDQTFALASARADGDPAEFRRYWLTTGVGLGAGWVAAVALGVAFGPVLPANSPLDLAAPACFVGLLAPKLVDRAAIAGAGVAAITATAAAALPSGLGLLCGVVAGLLAARMADRGTPASTTEPVHEANRPGDTRR